MGGLVIETVRPGVQFTPEAAAAFRRAEAQVRAEFRRDIDSNSTHRDWDKQMSMHNAWNRYVASGYQWSLYPGHSKAIHPMYSRHVHGLALDSDDWRNDRIVQILADNGFIRNQLHVPNEQHHFEYIRSRDKNYGKPANVSKPKPKPKPIESEEDDMPIIIAQRKNPALAKGRWIGGGKIQEITKHENTLLREAQAQNRDAVIYATVPDATYAALVKGQK